MGVIKGSGGGSRFIAGVIKGGYGGVEILHLSGNGTSKSIFETYTFKQTT